MLAFERREKILYELQINKKVFVGDLARQFKVSPETIRRDLEKLEQDGIVTKSYGGARLNSHTNEDLPYKTRHAANLKAKIRISRHISALIGENTTIMADSGSTVFEALKELGRAKSHITVITNSVMALTELSSSELTMISTGGNLRKHSGSLVGSTAAAAIRRYNVDVAVLSCKALSMQNGITDSNQPESDIKTVMVQQAAKVILLADQTKFNETAFIRLFPFKNIDCLVTDKKPDKKWLRFLGENNVRVIF
jgi:DeoR/GlpR family transcriptional regulator of sugar metabolism